MYKLIKFIDVKFCNVLILGFGFMALFTAFQTMANIEKTVVTSIVKDVPTYDVNAYECLALTFLVYSFVNWLIPPFIVLTSPKIGLIIAGIFYTFFVFSFLLPMKWIFYTAGVLAGIAESLSWTGQGVYLAACSDGTTISRNVGLFWGMWQMSLIIGNIFVFYEFRGAVDYIEPETRQFVLIILGCCGILGIILLGCLRNVSTLKGESTEKTTESIEVKESTEATESTEKKNILTEAYTALKSAAKLFWSRDMLLLSVCFFYSGLQLTFYAGVYATSVGFTLNISDAPKEVVGLAGICIGVGEILAAIFFGWLGNKFPQMGHSPVLIVGAASNVLSYILSSLNLPNSSPFADTYDISIFNPPISWLALICAFLLGVGDAGIHMKVFALLGTVYADESVAAFALYNFITGIGAAVSFFWSTYLGLHVQSVILSICAIIAAICFTIVDRKNNPAIKSKVVSEIPT